MFANANLPLGQAATGFWATVKTGVVEAAKKEATPANLSNLLKMGGQYVMKKQEAKAEKKLTEAQERIAQIQAQIAPPATYQPPSQTMLPLQIAGIPTSYIILGGSVLILGIIAYLIIRRK